MHVGGQTKSAAIALRQVVAQSEGNMTLTDGEFRVNLNGVTHWCRVAGAAHCTIPLLILHGGPGGNVYNFERTIGPHLEAFATVLYFEQRGCGRSDAPDDPDAYSIPLLVADLHALRCALQLEHVIPLGFSFGGELALEYALAYPSAVTKVIVQAPGVSFLGRTALVQLYGFEQITQGTLRQQIQQIITGPEPADDKLARVWTIVERSDVDRFLFHQPDVAAMNRRLWGEWINKYGSDGAGALCDLCVLCGPIRMRFV